MTTDYDPIAEQYKRSKQQPWRAHIEAHTFMGLLGDLSGMSVVDIACGEGFYSRMIRQRGAAEVIGVDLSVGMIELARKAEAGHRLGIDYRVGDGRAPELGRTVDLAVAAYLLNYSHDRDELAAMCRGVASCLGPGGRFVTVNQNPALDFSAAPSFRKYEFETEVVGPFREGAPITWTFYLPDGPFSIENYHLDVACHESALRGAGFREVRWHAPRLAEAGIAEHGRAFWDDFLAHSPVAFIECLK